MAPQLCDRSRRTCIAAVLVAALQPLSGHAHTPYKQWAVYRQKHLLIGCHKDVPATYDLSKQIVSHLEGELPAASARVARAPAASRLASLMATDQLNIAILAPELALAMASGSDKFAVYGSIELTTLLAMDGFLLVGHSRLKDHHCWQITKALEPFASQSNSSQSNASQSNASQSNASKPALPWHKGSELYLLGEPMPNKL